MANGLLHIPERSLGPHRIDYFSTNALPYSFNDPAGEPREFLKFLSSILPNDQNGIAVLQEFAGYALTTDTMHHKALLLIGPRRSGKGTLARVLRGLVGDENVAAPSLSAMTNPFGLEPLLGKKLAIVGDARLSRRTDGEMLAERLLSLTGQDKITVERKHKTAWSGQLPTRVVVLAKSALCILDIHRERYLAGFWSCSSRRVFMARRISISVNDFRQSFLPFLFGRWTAWRDCENDRNSHRRPRTVLRLRQLRRLKILPPQSEPLPMSGATYDGEHNREVDRRAIYQAWCIWLG